ncbi:MAG: RNA 3'-terminal phosphate cyclase [Burkholderiales bacterium]
MADETADALLEFLDSDGAVDAYLADQLLPLAFAKGESLLRTSKVTGHMLTNAGIIGRFLPIEIGIQAEENKSALVRISPLA